MSDYNAKHLPYLAPAGLPPWLAEQLPSCYGPDFNAVIALAQRELGLKSDGQCGPKTIKALAARDYEPGRVIVGPLTLELDVEIKTYLDQGFDWLADTKTSPRAERVTLGVIHYDVTNDSKTTHNVLMRRELSTHFMIDADGVIYQCHDPVTEVCHHAGSRANRRALGLDLNSPALREYERLKPGQQPRPVVKTTIHGQRLDMLDYWPAQIKALKALMVALEQGLKLPLSCPRTDEGKAIYGAAPDHLAHHGWIGHYHITTRKIDPAPLDWDAICPA